MIKCYDSYSWVLSYPSNAYIAPIMSTIVEELENLKVLDNG